MAKNLSSLEHELMTILWQRGPCTVDEVRDRLPSSRPLKDSTVRTVLRRLEDKGFVRHAVEGRANVYRAAVRPERALGRVLRQVVDRFCGGSVEALLVGMVANRMTSREELQRLAETIERSEPGDGDHPGSDGGGASAGRPARDAGSRRDSTQRRAGKEGKERRGGDHARSGKAGRDTPDGGDAKGGRDRGRA